jgi:hypothetical protein
MTEVLAGFECGRLGWNGHDLLVTTRHVPEDRMADHYRTARAHGLVRARDGLPWRHDPGPRLRVAEQTGLGVIWDLNHFDPPDDPVAHARRVADAANHTAPLWLCPVNEPSLYPALCGMALHDAVGLAMTMARVARDHHPDVRLLATDPITGIGERQFAATDALVGAGLVDMIGVNYYPHTARTALRRVLAKVARRYALPILVSETSWHDGHPRHHRRHPGWTKGDWLHHILDEVAAAEARGAAVTGVCWYPFVDCPPWDRPRAHHRWSHGLIRADLGVDPHLGAALLGRRQPAGQLSFDYRKAG